MQRRAAVVGVVVALSMQIGVAAGAEPGGHDHGDHDHAAAAGPTRMVMPMADPARGVVTTGLRIARSGPCMGLLEIVEEPLGSPRCTHGPDAAPEDGRDVRSEQLDPNEAQQVVATAPAFACDGDGQAGRRAHAIYAHAPDRADRFATYEAAFKGIIANVQDQVRQSSLVHGATDPLVYRFTHTAPSGGTCEPLVDNVDLPSNTDDDSFGATVNALEEMGYTRSDRRYLVFVDANVLCGIGHLYGDDRADPAANWNNVLYQPLFSRVDAGCWDYAETHELFHNIGAVQDSSPNSSGAGHCNDNYDLMCYADGGSASALYTRCADTGWELRLDCGGDDYFHPAPSSGSYLDSHWNTADSGWLFVESTATGGGSGGTGGATGGGSTGGGSGDGGGGTTAPSVGIAAPANSASVPPTFTVSGTATDADGDLDRVVVKVDGQHARTLRPSTSSWSTSLTVASGARTVTVAAYDLGGRSASASRTYVARPPDLFTDDDGSVFEDAINTIAAQGVTRGCNPPTNDRFCPDRVVTRGQMAAFITRALDLPAGRASFTDTAGSPFADDIARLAGAGITRGCNPPENTRFCPDRAVTRAQMAAFLARALDLPASSVTFRDTGGSPFAADIARLAQAGITRGCNPPDNDRFCPDRQVTRAQMAAFLARALY